MRIESSVTSISWIPSEAVEGTTKLPFELGVAHYDPPPPDHIDDLEALRVADRFRFANELRAWIDVDDNGRITDYGYGGGGHIGSTTLRLGGKHVTLAAVPLPDRQQDPDVGPSHVRFVQTAGGRTGAPAPRRVSRPPFVQIHAPLAWTTLGLTIFSDGTSSHDVVGASTFPRHWIYDHKGDLSHKSGLVDFNQWMATAFGTHTPWGEVDSPALITEVETALERQLSTTIMRGGVKPRIAVLREGEMLVHQGDEGKDVFLILDGVVTVDIDGETVAHIGPGGVLGERALLEGGLRTATLLAATRCRVASIDGNEIDPTLLAELASGHKREAAPA